VTTNDTNPTAVAVRRSVAVEQRFAVGEIIAPVATAGLMLAVDQATAATVATFLSVPAVVAAANFVGFISPEVLDKVPGGDIIRAHRLPFLVSTLTTAVAAATGAIQGIDGVTSLLAGWMEMPTAAGAISAGWLTASGFVAFSLRRVIGRRAVAAEQAATQHTPGGDGTNAHLDILQPWADYISGRTGTNPGQDLDLTHRGPHAWAGQIVSSAPGKPVTVTPETVSGVYQLPVEWIHIAEGPHGSTKTITVRLIPPDADDAGHELQEKWKRVGRPGGLMAGTHLEDVTPDPNSGGHAAWIVADPDTNSIRRPDMLDLAGALRTKILLVSYEPTDDPRRAILRVMRHSPLEHGQALPGPDALLANENGFIKLGLGVSGRPTRIQIYDPKAGAQHVLVTGVTGSGKGGVLQLLALSYHVNGFAIIYADPKGSSNPDVEDMAAYAGCGPDEAMGALRVAYAIFRNRVAESRGRRAKNFTPTPDRPYVAVILDEMVQLFGEKSPYKAEAVYIAVALSGQSRSLGMCLVLCGQIINLDQMGNSTAIRNNVFGGGSLILLRSDRDQKNRVDLPPSFAGIDPSSIPAYWKPPTSSLVYDPDVPENDPRRTFGVGYVAGPDEAPEQFRSWVLESAAGLWNPQNVVIPADFPDWHDRDRIAATPVLGGKDDEDEDDMGGWVPAQAVPAMTKEPTAKEKVLQVLSEFTDPIGEAVTYLHVDQITKMTGAAPGTIANACSELMKDKKIIRGSEKGTYGIPITPIAD
jgi:hypothetical protein